MLRYGELYMRLHNTFIPDSLIFYYTILVLHIGISIVHKWDHSKNMSRLDKVQSIKIKVSDVHPININKVSICLS